MSEAELEEAFTVIFFDNKARYGARKIKKVLETKGKQISLKMFYRQ